MCQFKNNLTVPLSWNPVYVRLDAEGRVERADIDEEHSENKTSILALIYLSFNFLETCNQVFRSFFKLHSISMFLKFFQGSVHCALYSTATFSVSSENQCFKFIIHLDRLWIRTGILGDQYREKKKNKKRIRPKH